MKTDQKLLAHVRCDEKGEWQIHSLEEHLRDVGKLAGRFGASFNAQDWAALAGLWHDLGKYNPEFQRYISAQSGYDPEAHLEGKSGKVDHSTAGAIHATERHKAYGRILAYLIAGHHSGLPDWFKGQAEGRGLEERLRDSRHLEAAKQGSIPKDVLNAALPTSMPPPDPEHAHLWVRMLFSCLVDADFLDTESFMDPEKASMRDSNATLRDLHVMFMKRMADRDSSLKVKGDFDLPVNQIRRRVWEDCRKAAEHAPGFFSLEVPTGGGKTLSSMAFALDHALRHGKIRIVMAIPYTSIIEQTAQVLSGIFGPENVLEHHSNLDSSRETVRGRLAAENWDAPIVVTTNVQLFESLFAARTSRCRKLHNLANSVVILDEAQMLPPEKLAPTLSVLKGLVKYYGCTVVLCTATQPALVGEIGSGKAKFRGLDDVRKIVGDPESLTKDLQRVSLRLHGSEKVDWESLSTELSGHRQVLCIVNRRQDCRELWQALQERVEENPIHLSALMCGEHRSKVIKEIKNGLGENQPLRVISTQLVEAGVDIDFPVVYRAMAGLDSIAQAAGRCNREGRLNLEGKLGEVVVFHPPKSSPPGLLLKGEYAGDEVMRNYPELVQRLDPEGFRRYFQCFYSKVNDFGKDAFERDLVKDAGTCQFQFRSVPLWYQLIEEQGYQSILVWYESGRLSSKKVLQEVEYAGLSRDRMRRLQRFAVNVPRHVWRELYDQGAIMELQGPDGGLGLWVQAMPGLYDDTFGLRLEGPQFDVSEFIV